MHLLIDQQKSVEVQAEVVTSDGDEYHVIGIDDTCKLLDAWRDLDISRRAYSWPGSGDRESLCIMWYTESAGLVYEWVSPFWDGVIEHDAHSVEAIAIAVAGDSILWGERIGEPSA